MALLEAGWRVGIVWECSLRPQRELEVVAASIEEWLNGQAAEFVAGRA